MKRFFIIIVPISIAIVLTLTQCGKDEKEGEDVLCETIFKP
jgi:hypothetical protein